MKPAYRGRDSSQALEEGSAMTTRREFLRTSAAAAGLVFVGCDLLAARPARAQARRREVFVDGKRVKTIDVHAHCAVPEALTLLNLKLAGPGLRTDLDMATQLGVRLQAMDEQGIDVQALSINPNWYKADRDLAKQVCAIQNEKLAADVGSGARASAPPSGRRRGPAAPGSCGRP